MCNSHQSRGPRSGLGRKELGSNTHKLRSASPAPVSVCADLLDGSRTGVRKDIFRCVAYKSRSSIVSSSMTLAPLYSLG